MKYIWLVFKQDPKTELMLFLAPCESENSARYKVLQNVLSGCNDRSVDKAGYSRMKVGKVFSLGGDLYLIDKKTLI